MMVNKTDKPATTNKSTNTSPPARLRQRYVDVIRPELKEELGLANTHQVPRLSKIVVSAGLGKFKEDKRVFEAATNTLAKITGQQPVRTLARQSIAGFKLREGQPIGLKVTLRGDRMYEFMDRLIHIVLPRLRDFHGVPSSAFDAQANYTLGLADQSVFPELSYEETTTVHGLQITMVIDTNDQSHAQTLLSAFGMPFEQAEKQDGKE